MSGRALRLVRVSCKYHWWSHSSSLKVSSWASGLLGLSECIEGRMKRKPLELFLLLPELNQLLRNGLANPKKPNAGSLHSHLEADQNQPVHQDHLVKLLLRPLHPIVKEKGFSETPVLPPEQDFETLAEEHVGSAPSLVKAATEDKVSREGNHFAQVLISKLVGNLVWVDTRCETEKPKVIPMMGECPLSAMMLMGAAKRPCILWLNHHFFANGFINLESCKKSLIQTIEMFFFGVRIGP